jgi:hypothetical protein|tara:strand:+ start:181 stop:381 length:201 start_codon:yes stop_codon:yes gene_type:complete
MSAEQHYGRHNEIDRLNPPQKSEEGDWWDELCKQHGAKNHWGKKDGPQTKKTKVKKLKNKINKNSK